MLLSAHDVASHLQLPEHTAWVSSILLGNDALQQRALVQVEGCQLCWAQPSALPDQAQRWRTQELKLCLITAEAPFHLPEQHTLTVRGRLV